MREIQKFVTEDLNASTKGWSNKKESVPFFLKKMYL